jgi:hypothetical protein
MIVQLAPWHSIWHFLIASGRLVPNIAAYVNKLHELVHPWHQCSRHTVMCSPAPVHQHTYDSFSHAARACRYTCMVQAEARHQATRTVTRIWLTAAFWGHRCGLRSQHRATQAPHLSRGTVAAAAAAEGLQSLCSFKRPCSSACAVATRFGSYPQ